MRGGVPGVRVGRKSGQATQMAYKMLTQGCCQTGFRTPKVGFGPASKRGETVSKRTDANKAEPTVVKRPPRPIRRKRNRRRTLPAGSLSRKGIPENLTHNGTAVHGVGSMLCGKVCKRARVRHRHSQPAQNAVHTFSNDDTTYFLTKKRYADQCSAVGIPSEKPRKITGSSGVPSIGGRIF